MIENVGFLDETKNIVTDEDLEFKKATFAVAEDSLYNRVGGNFFWYNKYLGCFHGWLRMNECSIKARETVILKLPVKPLASEALITGFYNSANAQIIPIIDKEGNLMLNHNLEVTQNLFLDFVGTFPIIGGVKKLLLISLSKVGDFLC